MNQQERLALSMIDYRVGVCDVCSRRQIPTRLHNAKFKCIDCRMQTQIRTSD